VLLQDDAAAASWYPVNALPGLAFDHKQVIREAFKKLLDRPEVKQAGACINAARQDVQGRLTNGDHGLKQLTVQCAASVLSASSWARLIGEQWQVLHMYSFFVMLQGSLVMLVI
jgi:hypothetical protein